MFTVTLRNLSGYLKDLNYCVSQIEISSGNFSLKLQKSDKICKEIPKKR